MRFLFDLPALFLPVSLLLFLGAGFLGARVQRRWPRLLPEHHRERFGATEGAVLGMLALLLGFSFAMAVSRYDARRQLEVEEANDIGTTWLRTSLLGEPARAQMRGLLLQYVDARMEFSRVANGEPLRRSAERASRLQSAMWSLASTAANERRDSMNYLFVSSLNDMIDVSEKRRAALESRIPGEAWGMLLFIGMTASFLSGLAMPSRSVLLLVILPIVMACALTLILDLDAPRRGWIRVPQKSMERVQEQIHAGF
jgi:hypothetical protein